jgi:hypothetical protein
MEPSVMLKRFYLTNQIFRFCNGNFLKHVLMRLTDEG